MDNCPKCNANWIGNRIPDNIAEFYAPATHWRREIGIDGDSFGVYDGLVAYRCPDCNEEVPRGSSVWALEMFEKYIEAKNE